MHSSVRSGYWRLNENGELAPPAPTARPSVSQPEPVIYPAEVRSERSGQKRGTMGADHYEIVGTIEAINETVRLLGEGFLNRSGMSTSEPELLPDGRYLVRGIHYPGTD